MSPVVENILKNKSDAYYIKYLYLYHIRHYMNVYKTFSKNIESQKLTITSPNPEKSNLNRGKYYALVDRFIFSNGKEPSLKQLEDLLSSVSDGVQYKQTRTDSGSKVSLPIYNDKRQDIRIDRKSHSSLLDVFTDGKSSARNPSRWSYVSAKQYVKSYIDTIVNGRKSYEEDSDINLTIDKELDQFISNEEKIEVKLDCISASNRQ